jgi:hypothetical protein
VTVALFGLLGLPATPWALAGSTGRAKGTQTAASGTFAVTPVTPRTTLATGVLAFVTPPLTAPAYLDALNTGTIPIVGMTYSVSFTYAGLGTATLTLSACPGGAWDLAGACSTGAVEVGTWPAGSTTTVAVGASNLPTAYPAAAGARLPLKATVSGLSAGETAAATVSLSVSSGPTRQVRAAGSSNA